MPGRIALVINPHSRKNRGRDRAARMRDILGERGDVYVTRGVEELGPLMQRVLSSDLACLVSDGGDGALHCALNAALPYLHEGALPTFLPTNGGTIDFVGRKAAVRGDAEKIVARLVAALDAGELPSVLLDSMDIRGVHADGAPFHRIGFAAAIGGIGQRFFDAYYALPDPGAASIVKVVAHAVASLAATPFGHGEYAARMFRPFAARVWIDDVEVPAREHGAIHAGAFDVDLGGVFRVFPLARDPGVLQFQAGAITPREIVSNLPRLVAGGAIRGGSIRDTTGAVMRIEATSEESIRPVIDGEVYENLRSLEVRRGPVVRVAKV